MIMRKFRKGLAMLLAFVICVGMIPATVYADVKTDSGEKIVGFGEFIYTYTVANGTARDAIGLPETLPVKVEVPPAEDGGEAKLREDDAKVTWSGEYNAEMAGIYTLTAVFADGALSFLKMPSVTVTVEEADAEVSQEIQDIQETEETLQTNNEPEGLRAAGDYPPGGLSITAVSIKTGTPGQTTVQSNSSAAFNVTVQASADTPEGYNNVWMGYRFKLNVPIPDGADASQLVFTNNGHNWLMDLNNSAAYAVPTWDAGANAWILEGQYLYNRADDPLGSSAAAAYTLSIGVSDGWLIAGEKYTMEAESWVVADGEAGKKAAVSPELTITTTPTSDTYPENNSAPVSGWYSKTTGKMYATKSIANADGAADAVLGRVVKFQGTNFVNPELGNEIIKTGSTTTFTIPLKVTTKDGDETAPSMQPYLIGATVDGGATNVYTGSGAASDMSFGGRTDPGTSYANTLDSVTYAGGSITAAVTKKEDNGRVLMVNYQVFVPVDENDTADTKRTLNIGDASVAGLTSKGGTAFVETNINQIAKQSINPINDAEDFVGSYTSAIAADGAKQKPISSSFGLYADITNVNNSMAAEAGAFKLLAKFDSNAMYISGAPRTNQSTYAGGEIKFKYGVLKSSPVWDTTTSEGAKAMLDARRGDFEYYDTLEAANAAGTVTAVLMEGIGGTFKVGTTQMVIPMTMTDDALKSNKVYQMIKDAELWGQGKNPDTDTPDVTMVSDKYNKDSWDADGTYHPGDNNSIGASVLLVAYVSKIANPVNLNGTSPVGPNKSTFDVTNNERKVAVQQDIDIKFVGDAAVEDINREIEFRIAIENNYANKQWLVEQESITLDGTFTPDAADPQRKPGLITGGTKPYKIEAAGNTMYAYFKVIGSGSHKIMAHYNLGDRVDDSNDIKVANTSMTMWLEMVGASNAFSVIQENNATNEANIVRASLSGFKKSSEKTIVEQKDEIGYWISVTARDADVANTILLDVFPFNEDGRGTVMTGSYKTKPVKLKVSGESGAIRTALDLYYTTDAAIQSTPIPTADAFRGIAMSDGVSVLGATWNKAAAAGTGRDVSYDVPVDAKAVVVLGMTAKNETPMLHMTMTPVGNKAGNMYGNSASMISDVVTKPITSITAKVTTGTRAITGKTWKDSDGNGQQDAGEAGIENITVKLWQDTTEITENLLGEDYGTVKTAADGTYTFADIPSSSAAYHVTFEGTPIVNSQTTVKTAENVDADKNSDVTGTYEDGKLTKATSDEVILLTLQQQIDAGRPENIEQLDAGFVDAVRTITYQSADAAMGSVNPASEQVASSGTAVGSEAVPQVGYEFVNWTDADGSVVGTTAAFVPEKPANGYEDAVYTANFKAKDYQIIFDTDGGTPVPDTQTVTYDTLVIEPAAEPTKENFNFAGWYYTVGGVETKWDFASDKVAGDMTLTAKWTEAGKAAAVIAGTKTLKEGGVDKAIEAGQFSFVITADTGNMQDGYEGFTDNSEVTVNADGTFAFDSITFKQAGTYKFSITEKDGGASGYTYDTKTIVAEVKVVQDGTDLSASVEYSMDGDVKAPVFNNTYDSPEAVDVTLAGTKILTENGEAKAIRAGQFSFNIAAAEGSDASGYTGFSGAPADAQTDGTISFEEITFTKAGSYSFTAAEENKGAAGYTYDTEAVTAIVNVVLDTADNRLKAEVTYVKGEERVDGMNFVNTYTTPDPAEVTVSGMKTLSGAGKSTALIQAGQFTFQMKANEDNDNTGYTVAEEALSAATAEGGGFTFGAVTFVKAGSYKFTVTEDNLSAPGYTYDETEYLVTITATLNEVTNKLETEVVYSAGETAEVITFANTYTVKPVTAMDPPVEKIVNGKPPKAGSFEFRMKAVNTTAEGMTSETMPMPKGSKEGIKDVTIEGAGAVEFGTFIYKEAGTYTYNISEVKGKLEGYTYDEAIYTITDVVTDEDSRLTVKRTITKAGSDDSIEKAVFTNVYKAADKTMTTTNTTKSTARKATAKTGDETDTILFLSLCAAAGAVIVLMRRRKKAVK